MSICADAWAKHPELEVLSRRVEGRSRQDSSFVRLLNLHMPAAGKKLHHFVSRFYLRAWAEDNLLFCLQDGATYNPNVRNVAAENYFYKLEELNDEEISLLAMFINNSPETLKETHRELVRMHMAPFRGIDICGVEEHQPLWVSAQSLMRMREYSRNLSGKNSAYSLEPFRLTVHCGEDFRWLTSGTRAVAEPFSTGSLIQRGDRIGHGIALTLDPNQWWERHDGQVIQVKKVDRLLDLAFLAEYAQDRTAKDEEWLRDEIDKVARDLWSHLRVGTIQSIERVKDLWLAIGGRMARRLLQTQQLREEEPLHHHWLHSYLWNKKTQEKAEELLFFPIQSRGESAEIEGQRIERNLLIKARSRLITEVARWQVCIESNPSSNLVIASLDAMASQDFLQQRPTTVSKHGKETLPWSISTDNPVTFSTTLADEYAYAWAGMVLRETNGYDPSHARGLLDDAAATSTRARFTVSRGGRLRAGGKRA